MMRGMSKTDVIIAGGGIGGAVLAALLVRGGKAVTIVEKATGPPPFLRPELLWPPAMRILEDIRPREFWERECLGQAGRFMLDRRGRVRPVFTSWMFDAAGARPFFEHPNNTRETLLAICGAEVRRGVEVTGLLRDGGRVRGLTAREVATGTVMELEAELTVGDDGAHSAVRAACGLTCELHPFPAEFLAGTERLAWPQGWPADEVRVFLPRTRLPAGLLAFGMMPMPGGEAACLAIVWAGEGDQGLDESFAALMAGASGPPPPSITATFPANHRRIGRSWGHAARYGIPGVVLIGDAIHPVSPAGGQGANMAIGDGAALARFLLDGVADPADALERDRRSAHVRGLRPTRLAARAFRLGRIPGLGSVIRGMAGVALASTSLRIRVLRSLGQP
jgi:2-polyprenyl-6-methoxyphenol hydroxylase-like FAD-dependent oxidoreductase